MHWFIQRVTAMLGPGFAPVGHGGPSGAGTPDLSRTPDRSDAFGSSPDRAVEQPLVLVSSQHAGAVVIADGSGWSADAVAALLDATASSFGRLTGQRVAGDGRPWRIQCIVLFEHGLPVGIGRALPRLERRDGSLHVAMHLIDARAGMIHSGHGAAWMPPDVLLAAWADGPGVSEGPLVAESRHRPVPIAGEVRSPVLTYVLLGVLAAVHVVGWMLGPTEVGLTLPALLGAQVNALVLHLGQWWRPLTAIFLHADWLHLGMNSLALYQLGPVIEGTFGRRRFAVIWLTAGLAGNWLYLWQGPPQAWSVGASGAIFGLFGALVVLGLRMRAAVRRGFWWQIAVTLAINVYIGLAVPAINMWAHGGGFVAGLAWAAAMVLTEPGLPRRAALAAAGIGTALLVACAYLQV